MLLLTILNSTMGIGPKETSYVLLISERFHDCVLLRSPSIWRLFHLAVVEGRGHCLNPA